MAVELRNDCDGTAAATVTNANTTGPNQFTAVGVTGTGATLTFDTTHAKRGSTAIKLHYPTVATTGYLEWSSLSMTNVYIRFYNYMSGNPTVNTRICAWTFGAGTNAGNLTMTSTGLLRLVDSAGATVGATTGSHALNTWVRIEVELIGISGTTAATENMRAYSGNNGDSTIPDTNMSLSFSNVTVGAATLTGVRFMNFSGATETTAIDEWIDATALSDTAQPGTLWRPPRLRNEVPIIRAATY